MKRLLTIVLTLCLALTLGLAACKQQVTLTLYDQDGKTVIGTVTSDQGSAPVKPADPKKDGYTFKGWFVTPSSGKEFDFTKPLDEDAAAYAQWIDNSYVDDRDWVIVGSFNNWGKNDMSKYHLAKKSGTNNVYEITLDLYEGDKYQLTVLTSDGKLTYETEGARAASKHLVGADAYMIGEGGLGAYSDIKLLQDGNYTLTLTSAEETDSNRLEVKRNGDAAPIEEAETINYYIKGEGITYWADAFTPATMLKENADKKMEITVYLKANDQFMFTAIKTKGGENPTQADTFNFGSFDAESQKLFEDADTREDHFGNLKVKTAGYYTFVLNTETKKLSATFDSEKVREEMMYFVDGNFGGGTWGDYQKAENSGKLKLTKNGDIYTIEGVELKAGNELVIREHKASEETLKWENVVHAYDSKYLFGTAGFEAADKTNANIKVLADGKYNIIFDSYTHFVTIAVEGKDVYIKGSMQDGWKHNFKAEYKFAATENKEVYELVITLKADEEFGLETYNIGSKVGGVWVSAKDNLDTQGNANDAFDTTGHNLKCVTAGTYKITYNYVTGKVNVYTAASQS